MFAAAATTCLMQARDALPHEERDAGSGHGVCSALSDSSVLAVSFVDAPLPRRPT